MEKKQLQEIMDEITGLREKLHQLVIKNKKVTKEALQVSTILDQRINSFLKLSNRDNNC
ncbi:MAG TPA: Spo0E family sporulation regulatory protein-aspartic acid phosphatase [Firmicutes bacterium]|nr:Spo0E family sporulation regulatory protein-aspartic acid phosphatase [Bacillota bacterium]